MSCFKTKLISSFSKIYPLPHIPLCKWFSSPLWLHITDLYQLSLFLPKHQSVTNSFSASFDMSPFIDFMDSTPQEINNITSLYKTIQKCYLLKWILCPKTLMSSNCLENWNWTPWFHFQNCPSLFIFNILMFLGRNCCSHPSVSSLCIYSTNVDWALWVVHSVDSIYCKLFCFLTLFKSSPLPDLPSPPGFHPRLRSGLLPFFQSLCGQCQVSGFPHPFRPLLSPISVLVLGPYLLFSYTLSMCLNRPFIISICLLLYLSNKISYSRSTVLKFWSLISSISITWELVRNAGIQTPPQPYWVKILGVGPRSLVLTCPPGESDAPWSLRTTTPGHGFEDEEGLVCLFIPQVHSKNMRDPSFSGLGDSCWKTLSLHYISIYNDFFLPFCFQEITWTITKNNKMEN